MRAFAFTLSAISVLSPWPTGCSGSRHMTLSSGLEFRHPLLHHPVVTSPQDVGFPSLTLKAPPHADVQWCEVGFRHPILNHCEPWRIASLEPTLPANPTPSLDPTHTRLAIADRARSSLQNAEYSAGDREYSENAIGLILAIFGQEGIALDDWVARARPGETPLAALYREAASRRWVHRNKVPEIADLAFFDMTFDRNHDGKANDFLTHVNLVEAVDADGTVSIIHHGPHGVLRLKMNLFHPHERRDPQTGKVWNHYLKLGGPTKKGPTSKLTGELFHGFATLVRDR